MALDHFSNRRRAGLTLVELSVGLAVVAIMVAIATPAMTRMATRQRGRSTAHLISGAFTLARSEAIRTGRIHIVFFQTDAQGNPLQDDNGDPVSLVILDDGPPGIASQNCQIDAGESIRTLTLPPDVTPGPVDAAVKPGTDIGAGALVGASSFSDPGLNPASWVLFRPEGMPLAFDGACNPGTTGSGAGGFYVSAGGRDYAAVLLPLGGTRVHSWNPEALLWSN